MIESTRQVIQKFQLILPDSTILIGVSGGADSLALLHILYTLQTTFRCHLHVATLDHGLRGDASAADVQFVKTLAESWGMAVTVGQADVGELATHQKIGVEAAARVARYDFLAQTARQVRAERVAVAHHAGDQAETILMHLIRGAGGQGLGGMTLQSVMPGHPDLALIRPLLWATRKEIEAYCAENDLQPREDATNRDTSIQRNYIRWEIMPGLERLNPNVQRALAQAAEITQVENDYLERQLAKLLSSSVVQQREGHITINRSSFRDLHPALQRRFIVWAARQLNSLIEDLDYAHIIEAVEIGLRGRQGARALLTGGAQLRVDYDSLWIESVHDSRPSIEQPLLSMGVELDVLIPGSIQLSGGQWSLHASLTPFVDDVGKIASLVIPKGAVVTLRGMHEGDRFRPLGLAGHSQKLNRWMINRKVTRSIRDRIPLLCVDNEVAAIFVNSQWFIGEAYAVRDNSRQLIHFYFLENL